MAGRIMRTRRIFAVVDTWDSLRTERTDCQPWPEEETQQFLHSQAGKEFDPAVVKAFDEFLPVLPRTSVHTAGGN